MLFHLEFAPPIDVRHLVELSEESPADTATVDYAKTLAEGVTQHKAEIDTLISGASQHWKIDRMSGVDRNIMRIAVFEMFHLQPQIKSSIAINEAVDIAKVFGSTESGSFVNGILDQIARQGGLA